MGGSGQTPHQTTVGVLVAAPAGNIIVNDDGSSFHVNGVVDRF
jgi:hypothetical protein